MSDIQIAPAIPAHLPEILDQARATYLEHRARIPFVFRERLYRKIERKHKGSVTGENQFPMSFAATADGSLAGYVLLYSVLQQGMIYDISVFPAARRKGVGRALVAQSLAVGRERKWDKIFATVWDGNEASHRLFQASDFTPEKRLLGNLSRKLPHLRHTSYTYSLKDPPDQAAPI